MYGMVCYYRNISTKNDHEEFLLTVGCTNAGPPAMYETQNGPCGFGGRLWTAHRSWGFGRMCAFSNEVMGQKTEGVEYVNDWPPVENPKRNR